MPNKRMRATLATGRCSGMTFLRVHVLQTYGRWQHRKYFEQLLPMVLEAWSQHGNYFAVAISATPQPGSLHACHLVVDRSVKEACMAGLFRGYRIFYKHGKIFLYLSLIPPSPPPLSRGAPALHLFTHVDMKTLGLGRQLLRGAAQTPFAAWSGVMESVLLMYRSAVLGTTTYPEIVASDYSSPG